MNGVCESCRARSVAGIETTQLPWRLDIGSGAHGWLLIEPTTT